MAKLNFPYQIRTTKDDCQKAQKWCSENGLKLSEELRKIVESMANKQRIKEEWEMIKNENYKSSKWYARVKR